MKLNLPAGTTVRGVTFGTPRVGNAAWATFFDSQIADFTRMNNNRDMVPIVPGRRLGFRHPSGEIHIQEDGSVIACLGEQFSLSVSTPMLISPAKALTTVLTHNAAIGRCQI